MKIDVVLSGSSTKFPSHIGFTHCLHEHGYRFGRLAGNSGGGMIAGLIACGWEPERIIDEAASKPMTDYVSRGFFDICRLIRKGYLSTGDKLYNRLKKLTGGMRFKETKYPLYIIGSNYTKRSHEVFCFENTPNMEVALAIRITVSIPFAFQPVVYNGCSYRDGGVYMDYPIDLWKDFPRPRIGHLIYQTDEPPDSNDSGVFCELDETMHNLLIANVKRSIYNIGSKAITVRSTGLNLGMFEFDIGRIKFAELYNEGYINCKKAIESDLLNENTA